jgi:hypothetical protein
METVCFDELPPYPVRSFTYRNGQVRVDEVSRAIVYTVYTDIANRTQHTPCERFIVWLLVSTSYIGHHQGNYTITRVKTETKHREVSNTFLM